MKITSFKYFIKEAFINLFKNGLMSIASIITVSSCVFILITSYNVAANVDYMLQNVQSQIGMTIFINDSATSEEVQKLYDDLLTTEHVTDITFVSSEEAYNDFKESLEDSSAILDGIPMSVFPRSFEIYLDDNQYIDTLVNKAQQDIGEEGVKPYSSIRHAKQEADFISSFANVVRIVSIIMVVGLGFIGTIIIMNTIKITVNTRKTEINIMKYVGATDWFIRWPFIFEGILIGFFGALFPVMITFFSYDAIINKINETLGFASTLFVYRDAGDLFAKSTPLAIMLGILIGVIGSVTSIRKHLDV